MKNAAVAQTVNEPRPVKHVRIFLGSDGRIDVDPQKITLPWAWAGTIRWTLDIEGASFDGGGIWFPVVSDFQPRRVSEKVCEMDVRNDASLFAGPHKYDIKLLEGDYVIVIDPTVENDPPPPLPPGDERRRRRTRAAGARKA